MNLDWSLVHKILTAGASKEKPWKRITVYREGVAPTGSVDAHLHFLIRCGFITAQLHDVSASTKQVLSGMVLTRSGEHLLHDLHRETMESIQLAA